MLQKLILTIASIFLVFGIHAQPGTTEDEFNYILRGLADNLSKGQDIKAGYSLTALGNEETLTWPNGMKRSIQLYYFDKGSQHKAIAVKFTDSKNHLSFLCLPTMSSRQDLWDKLYAQVSALGDDWKLVLSWSLIKCLSLKALQ